MGRVAGAKWCLTPPPPFVHAHSLFHNRFSFSFHLPAYTLLFLIHCPMSLLAAPALDITFEDDDWFTPSGKPRLNRGTSVGNSWGVTSIGGGYDWSRKQDKAKENHHFDFPEDDEPAEQAPRAHSNHAQFQSAPATLEPAAASSSSLSKPLLSSPLPIYPTTMITPSTPQHILTTSHTAKFTTDPLSLSPSASPTFTYPTFTSRPHTPTSPALGYFASSRPPLPARSPTSPRPTRRSSQQRVSLIAGRVSIAPLEHPAPPTVAVQKLVRTGSSASLLSVAASTGPPTPAVPSRAPSPLPGPAADGSERSISEFVIQGELGRGAYGLVKKAREMQEDGTLGVRAMSDTSLGFLFPFDPHAKCLVSRLWSSNKLSSHASSPTAGKSTRNMELFPSRYTLCPPSLIRPTFSPHAVPGIQHGSRNPTLQSPPLYLVHLRLRPRSVLQTLNGWKARS